MSRSFVALELLKNANVASEMILPGCQDTGTAIAMGKKGQFVWTNGKDEEAISKGVFQSYTERNLRYSQVRGHVVVSVHDCPHHRVAFANSVTIPLTVHCARLNTKTK